MHSMILKLNVLPSEALVDIIGFIWELADSEVLSVRCVEGGHRICFLAFLDYVMVLMEIQICDGWVVFNDCSGEGAGRFHDLVLLVAASCAAVSADSMSQRVSVLTDGFEMPLDEDKIPHGEEFLVDLRSQARLLVRQVTGIQVSSKAVQIEAARTLARWAKEPCRQLVIGSEIAQESEAASRVIARSISTPRNFVTLQATYPFLAALKSISACPAAASLLDFLQQLRHLVCITDCSLLMCTFRELLALQEVEEKRSWSSSQLLPAVRTSTASTDYLSEYTATGAFSMCSSRAPTHPEKQLR
eukprot:TRINITY_DN45429_c0_g1_i1.p1 TRINITY_DN45429_c0_g1~~TRINITY_DN45429_c0_g1_i1.p1  ORF type:complete len:302 (-),score=45.23 TRINITY_DN45429_c0_g1_i1:172-1077(-)